MQALTTGTHPRSSTRRALADAEPFDLDGIRKAVAPVSLRQASAPVVLQDETEFLQSTFFDIAPKIRGVLTGASSRGKTMEALHLSLPHIDAWTARLDGWKQQYETLDLERLRPQVEVARDSVVLALAILQATSDSESLRGNTGFVHCVESIENAQKEISRVFGELGK